MGSPWRSRCYYRPRVDVSLAQHIRCRADQLAPGANVAGAGHTGADNVPVPVNAPSTGCTSVSVTFPVLVTKKLKVTVCPALAELTGTADFSRVSAGAWVIVTTAVDGPDTGVVSPGGGTAVAVAVLLIVPASTSACVATYVAVHVTCAPGSSEAAPAGQVTAGGVPLP